MSNSDTGQAMDKPLVKIFVSYSHKDPEYLGNDSLLGYLRGLEREGDVEFWTDDEIEAGSHWDDEIKNRIRSSHIALVLVSQAFLDSSYCADIEIAGFLQRSRDEGLVVFPIVLSPCEWERYEWLTSRQFLPGGDETIEEHYCEPGKRKRLYLRIRRELRNTIEKVQQRLAESDKQEPPPAEPVAERRQLTMLRCGLVVSGTDSAPLDPEDQAEVLHEALPEFRRLCTNVIERLEGHIGQTLGTGLLAYFGYPLSHEDDGRRAVQAGLEIVEALQPLDARFQEELEVRLMVSVGIHTGPVVGILAGQRADEELAQGETPALADQLRALAEPNSVVISEVTYYLIKGFFETLSLDKTLQGGRARPIKIFRVTGDTGAETRLQALARQGGGLKPLVGRQQELALTLNRWGQAREGQGHAVLLIAEAGIGKSRLIEEFKNTIQEEPHYFVEFQGSAYHQNSALYPAIAFLSRQFSLNQDDPPAVQLRKLEDGLGSFSLPVGEVIPLLAPLMSLPLGDQHILPELSPKEQKEQAMEVLAALMGELSLRYPVVFIVDDLQWVDPSTLEFITLVIEQMPTVPLFGLFACRPEFSPPWRQHSYITQINLARLDPEETAQMIGRLVGEKPLPPEIQLQIVGKTEGVPLFIEDLTQMVIESGMVREEDGRYVMAGAGSTLTIPETLQETLLARLGQLGSARAVAQVGALFGREFSYEVLHALGLFNEATLKGELNQLVDTGFVYRRGFLSRARYIFKHMLVQEVLCNSLLRRKRKTYHKLIAEVLDKQFPRIKETEPELLAYHFTEAGLPKQAVAYWVEAVQRDLRASANMEAAAHAKQGLAVLELLPHGDERDHWELQLQMLRGSALLANRGWAGPELGACFSRARELSLKLGETSNFQMTVMTGLHYVGSGRLKDAIALAEELLGTAKRERDEDLQMAAHAILCAAHFWLGQFRAANAHGQQGLELYDPGTYHLVQAQRYGEDLGCLLIGYSILSLWQLGYPERAEALNREALELVDAFTHVFSRGYLLLDIIWHYVQLGDAPNVAKQSQALLDLSEDQDFVLLPVLARLAMAWGTAVQGQPDEGIAGMTEQLATFQATGSKLGVNLFAAMLASACREVGRLEEGLHWLRVGFESAEKTGDRYFLPELHRLKGDLLPGVDASDTEAEECFQEAIRMARTQESRSLELRAVMSLCRLWQKQGKSEQAHARLAECYEGLSEGRKTADLQEAERLLAALS